VMYQSSYRIIAICPDLRPYAGSAVAISGRQLITARHVLSCGGSGPMVVKAVGMDGEVYPMNVEAVSTTADAVRIGLTGVGRPFVIHPRATTRLPQLGERVCIVGGDSPIARGVRKCGDTAVGFDGYVFVSLHAVPGNSGGGAFSASGELVGIVSKASWESDREFVVLITPTASFGDLLDGVN
jgi:hypothetical protein